MNRKAVKPKPTPAAVEAARFGIRLQPGASKDRLIGKVGEQWKLSVAAPPVEGRANRACVELIARLLDVRPSAVTIVRGLSSRAKIIEVEGLSRERIEKRLEMLSREP